MIETYGFSTELTVLLTILGFASGFVNSISGGGGMLVLPALLWAGIPTVNALATNKCQTVFGSMSSGFNYYRNGYVQIKPLVPALICAALGAVIGTSVLQILPDHFLKKMIPVLMIGLAIYSLLSPRISDSDSNPMIEKAIFHPLGGFGIGFYGGFFGPGMGIISAILFASMLGYNIRKATANAKMVTVTANLFSFFIFIISGQIIWQLAVPMLIAQIVGGRVGSSLVIKKGVTLVKPVVITISLIISIRILIHG